MAVVPGSPAARPVARIAALDFLRGAVMILMAIDHVRVYAGVPAGGPTAGLFFTRWVTHFCAPAFAFLAGTSAFLYGLQLGDRGKLARHLVTRGLLLVLLELTVIRFAWTFNVDYSQFILAGVIWMLGWCMVLLAALLWLPTWAIGLVGLAVIFGQQLLIPVGQALPQTLHVLFEFIYPTGADVKLGMNGPSIAILYVIVPWIGVMAAGYGFGAIVVRDPVRRNRLCLWIGLTMTAAFVVIGGVFVALDPVKPDSLPALFRLLNQRKYPASPLFLLMTLGPLIALIPLADRARGWLADVVSTFGRVPMFYYLLHIPTIHLVALLVWYLRDGQVHPEWFAIAPFAQVPPDLRWGLPLLYLAFVVVIALLYWPCRWLAQRKANGTAGWLRVL